MKTLDLPDVPDHIDLMLIQPCRDGGIEIWCIPCQEFIYRWPETHAVPTPRNVWEAALSHGQWHNVTGRMPEKH